jgi:methylenetetrahydrofolate dehydrogenase (NADP+)/methenyltetrahydrofolate cyclohydrolase
VLMNTSRLVPPVVDIGLYDYPEDPLAEIRARGYEVHAFDAMAIAMELGDVRLGNTVMLGAMADHLPFSAEVLLESILKRFRARKPKMVEVNQKAFEAGREADAAASHDKESGARHERRTIIDGNALSTQLRSEFANRAAAFKDKGVTPCLAVILVGEDPASAVYVRNKVAGCEKAGMRSIKDVYAPDVAQSVVLARIAELNADPAVHGILVQLPLPKHFDSEAVLESIAPEKDVDGFHAENVGALMQGNPRFIPCTPYGVMKMLESAQVPLKGAEVVVVGRSNIVGKPMAMLLLAQSCTVTICHSQSKDLAFHTRRADILIAAVGRERMITGDMIKPGATVIDVGINRFSSGPNAGKLCGDVDFDTAKEVAGITPVPGGVGPMTITMLLANTLEAAERTQTRCAK